MTPVFIRQAYKNENLDTLEAEIKTLRKHDPRAKVQTPILRWLGATLCQKGEHLRGHPHLREGLADTKTPVKPLLWRLYAESSLAIKQHHQALAAADSFLKIETNRYRKAEAHFIKARAQVALKQFDPARESTSEALRLNPQGDLNYQLRMFAGDIDIADKKPGEAVRHYAVAESLYAKTPEQKKESKEKVIATYQAIGTPEALKKLKDYQ